MSKVKIPEEASTSGGFDVGFLAAAGMQLLGDGSHVSWRPSSAFTTLWLNYWCVADLVIRSRVACPRATLSRISSAGVLQAKGARVLFPPIPHITILAKQ